MSAPHQLARQRFDRIPEALVAGYVEQFIDDLLQRRRINVTPERLCNFPDRVVGRRHAQEIVLLGQGGMPQRSPSGRSEYQSAPGHIRVKSQNPFSQFEFVPLVPTLTFPESQIVSQRFQLP